MCVVLFLWVSEKKKDNKNYKTEIPPPPSDPLRTAVSLQRLAAGLLNPLPPIMM